MAKGRKTGGHVASTPNKATAEVRVAAEAYTVEAVQILAGIMRMGQSDQARIAAATALLDRGHGRPAQAVTGPEGDDLAGAIKQIIHVHQPATHE